jgi:O-antigen/teichoic acid export membrane protein
MNLSTALTRRTIASLSLGLLGGAALIATESMTTRGPMIFIPYGILVLGSLAWLRSEKIHPFRQRFTVALGAFMLATTILMGWLITVANPAALTTPIWNKVWPLLMMLALGVLFSSAVAHLSGIAEKIQERP